VVAAAVVKGCQQGHGQVQVVIRSGTVDHIVCVECASSCLTMNWHRTAACIAQLLVVETELASACALQSQSFGIAGIGVHDALGRCIVRTQ
jgi:hypothetical protein